MKKKPLSPFRKQIEALVLAGPWCLAPRFEGWAHCYVASVCGAEALRRLGINAKPVPCTLMAQSLGDTRAGVSIGFTPESLAQKYGKNLIEGIVDQTGGQTSVHMIIEAEQGREIAHVDLTIRQITDNTQGAIPAPFALRWYGPGWHRSELCRGDTPVGIAEYGEFPHPEQVDPRVYTYQNEGLVGDLLQLMGVARQLGLKREAFTKAMTSMASRAGFDI